MIVSLRGVLREKGPTSAWIEAGGVGYGVQLSLSTFESLPAEGAEVELLTVLVVREDSQQLYGFASSEERRLFNLLLTVSGVGPRVALGLLSGLRPEALARAIRAADLGSLTRVSGVGKKTAERILVELRDRVEPEPGAAAAPISQELDDAVTALVTLGYTPSAAQTAVRRAVDGLSPDPPVEEIVRRALATAGRA